MKTLAYLISLAGLLVAGISYNGAFAASIETLLMPGKVIEGHAKYEEDCKQCHSRLGTSNQKRLCLDCHEEIDADVKKKEGFHGRTETVSTQECRSCHTDHIGRDADVVGLNKETFDHKFTDFPLKGAHTKVYCDSCHAKDKKYLEAPSACYDCHKEDEPHKGRLGKKCEQCHNERAWKQSEFDHDKETDFPLKGHHKDATCNSCHPNERYKDTPQNCYACHKLNDVHNTRYGKKCQTCHTPKDWDKPTFDHDKDTDYPLIGRHKKTLCDACHTGHLYDDKLKDDCYSCHKSDDQHKGQNGTSCDKCHTPKSWSTIGFNHDKDTDFPLRGKHKPLECTACHKGGLYKDELKTECVACHKADDVHRGQQGDNCAQCHDESGWGSKVVFDHDLTDFPLIGLHATVPCEECHISRSFKDAKKECDTCHKKDDIHKKTLGPHCEQCHNPNGWPLWQFDHNTQTDFKLDGKHEGLQCSGCHKKTVSNTIKLSHTCESCHRKDDPHFGQFGRNCERCHSTKSFEDAKLP